MSTEPVGGTRETGLDLHGFARGSLASVAGTAAAGFLQFLVVVTLTRGLRVGEAGTFFETLALVTILGTAGVFGAEAGLVREIARRRALGRREDVGGIVAIGLVPVVAVGLSLGVVVYLLAPEIAQLAFQPAQHHKGVSYLRVLSPAIPLTALLSALLAATRGFGTMRATVVVQQLAIPAARPLLVGLVLALGLGATALGLAWTLPLAAGALAALALLRRLVEREKPAALDRRQIDWRSEALAFWRFAGARGLASTIALVTMLDVVLVGALDSARAAAVYAAASRFVIVSAFLLLAIGRPLGPRFSELIARADRTGIERLYRVSTWWTVAAAWPAYLLLAVFAPVFMRVFGSSYAGGGAALAILALGCLVDLATGNLLVLLLMSGKSTWNLANSAAVVALNVCLNVVLIPPFGIKGAAVAWTASIVLDCLATLLQVVYFFGIRPFGRTYLSLILGCASCFAAVGGIARLVLGVNAVALVVSAVTGSIPYIYFLRRSRESLALGSLWQALRGSSAQTAPASDRS